VILLIDQNNTRRRHPPQQNETVRCYSAAKGNREMLT
jgi:hypothetical protein